MFPTAGAQVYYNKMGEPLGWDHPGYDDGPDPDDFDDQYDDEPDDDGDIEDRWNNPDTNDGIEFADERDNT